MAPVLNEELVKEYSDDLDAAGFNPGFSRGQPNSETEKAHLIFDKKCRAEILSDMKGNFELVRGGVRLKTKGREIIKKHKDSINDALEKIGGENVWHSLGFYQHREEIAKALYESPKEGEYTVQNLMDDAGVGGYSIGYGESRTLERCHHMPVVSSAYIKDVECVIVFRSKRKTMAYHGTGSQNQGWSFNTLELKEGLSMVRKVAEKKPISYIDEKLMKEVVSQVL